MSNGIHLQCCANRTEKQPLCTLIHPLVLLGRLVLLASLNHQYLMFTAEYALKRGLRCIVLKHAVFLA